LPLLQYRPRWRRGNHQDGAGLEGRWIDQAPTVQARPAEGTQAGFRQQRLHRYESERFEFLHTPEVSPTNNLAERTVRHQVIAPKIIDQGIYGPLLLGYRSSVIRVYDPPCK
jgi:hypothetical protein